MLGEDEARSSGSGVGDDGDGSGNWGVHYEHIVRGGSGGGSEGVHYEQTVRGGDDGYKAAAAAVLKLAADGRASAKSRAAIGERGRNSNIRPQTLIQN